MGAVINVLVTSGQDENRKHILDTLSNKADFHIAGVEKDESGAIIKSARLKPDVLIMDIQMHGIDGPELAPIIHRRSPATTIAVICEKDEDDYADRALKAGISGILIKEADMDKLAPIIKIVFSGGYYISASITNRIIGAFTFLNQFPGQAADFSKSWLKFKADYRFFSPAERGIIANIAQGLSDREISEKLHFSPGTIRNYLTAIKRRTNLKNRTQIVIYSLIYGLISFDQISICKNHTNHGHIRHDTV